MKETLCMHDVDSISLISFRLVQIFSFLIIENYFLLFSTKKMSVLIILGVLKCLYFDTTLPHSLIDNLENKLFSLTLACDVV